MKNNSILVNSFFPTNSMSQYFIKLILLCAIGCIMLTLSSKIQVPFWPVPMTMQTFVVFILGMSYGFSFGSYTVISYLLLGAIGLPVFANSPEKGVGLVYFTGPTMGYLIGFLVAVYFAGFCKNSKKNNYLNIFFRLFFSVSFIYILGLLWLGYLIGWDKPIFKLGAQPFLLAELFKLALLTVLYPWIIKINIKLFG